MTGIERLREFAKGCRLIGQRAYSNAIGDIADQIEREQDKVSKTDWDTVRKVSADMADRVFMSATIDELLRDWSRKLNDATDGHVASDSHEARASFSRMRVLAVVTDMERHVLGHEGMEDSPVARWARELREALGATMSRHESDGVASSPCDDLSDDEIKYMATVRADAMEAWRWVRERGGMGAVRASVEQGIREHGYLCDIASMLGTSIYDGTDNADALLDKLSERLMPEGMEWLRYDTDEPVPLGGEVTVTVHDDDGDFDRTLAIRSIKYKENGVLLEGTKNEMVILSHGERVKRPDSWERLEDDCAKSDVDYCAERGLLDPSCDTVEGEGSTRHCTDCGCTCGEKMARDLVRRAKALAERDA